MLRREPFRQTLVGCYFRAGATASGEPATLELVGERPLLLPGLGRSLSVTGSLRARGLLPDAPLRGRLVFDRWLPFAVRYDLELDGPDGQTWRLHASRPPAALGPLARASSVHAELSDALGARIATFELRFDLRKDLLRYLT